MRLEILETKLTLTYGWSLVNTPAALAGTCGSGAAPQQQLDSLTRVGVDSGVIAHNEVLPQGHHAGPWCNSSWVWQLDGPLGIYVSMMGIPWAAMLGS